MNEHRPVAYEVDKETGCWLCTSHHRSRNEGSTRLEDIPFIAIGGKRISILRYMWRKHRGPLPKGAYLYRICKTRGCINPNHLRALYYGGRGKEIVTEDTADGCRVCTSHGSDRDRPRVNVRGRLVPIQRIVYEQEHGPIPGGMRIYALCGRTNCISIGHLRIASWGRVPRKRDRRISYSPARYKRRQ